MKTSFKCSFQNQLLKKIIKHFSSNTAAFLSMEAMFSCLLQKNVILTSFTISDTMVHITSNLFHVSTRINEKKSRDVAYRYNTRPLSNMKVSWVPTMRHAKPKFLKDGLDNIITVWRVRKWSSSIFWYNARSGKLHWFRQRSVTHPKRYSEKFSVFSYTKVVFFSVQNRVVQNQNYLFTTSFNSELAVKYIFTACYEL